MVSFSLLGCAIVFINHIRFATRSLRFMDTYHKGLNSHQAAWAAKKYQGHCMVPKGILEEFEAAHPGAPPLPNVL